MKRMNNANGKNTVKRGSINIAAAMLLTAGIVGASTAMLLCGCSANDSAAPADQSGNAALVTTVTAAPIVSTHSTAAAEAEEPTAAEAAVQTAAVNNAQAEQPAAAAQTTASAVKSEDPEEAKLVAKAQEYHSWACRQYWDMRHDFQNYAKVDVTYPTDENGQSAGIVLNYSNDENGGYLGVLVTDPEIKTIDDVMKIYGKTFDSRYDDGFRNCFKEYNGKVYWGAGQRGGNIYYVDSEVTGVKSLNNDEIVFNVDDHYDGTNIDGTAPWTEQRVFSVVVQPDGEWKVGQFTLPY